MKVEVKPVPVHVQQAKLAIVKWHLGRLGWCKVKSLYSQKCVDGIIRGGALKVGSMSPSPVGTFARLPTYSMQYRWILGPRRLIAWARY